MMLQDSCWMSFPNAEHSSSKCFTLLIAHARISMWCLEGEDSTCSAHKHQKNVFARLPWFGSLKCPTRPKGCHYCNSSSGTHHSSRGCTHFHRTRLSLADAPHSPLPSLSLPWRHPLFPPWRLPLLLLSWWRAAHDEDMTNTHTTTLVQRG